LQLHNAPSIFSQMLSTLIPIMSSSRICNLVGPHGSGKTTLLRCYAKHVASSHAQVMFSSDCAASTSSRLRCRLSRRVLTVSQRPGEFAWVHGVWVFEASELRSMERL
jgi:ABC-type cobalamin/Fe3+-siderophores transport system ATPase subunit